MQWSSSETRKPGSESFPRFMASCLIKSCRAGTQPPLDFADCRVAALQRKECLVDLVRDDDAIIDRAQPARHDDADGTGVIKAGQFLRQIHRDLQSFELRS